MSTSRRAAGLTVVAATAWFWAVFLSMHVVEPEFSPVRAPGSVYVLGAYGAWMTTTYFALSAALLSAGLGVAANAPASAVTRVARVAFMIASVGTVLAGLFPMDFPGPPSTPSGRMHALGGALTFPCWALGTLLFSLGMRRDPRWRRRSGLLLRLSATSIGIVVTMILSMLLLGFAGYAQRLLLAVLFAWMLVVAHHMIRVPHQGDEAPSGAPLAG